MSNEPKKLQQNAFKIDCYAGKKFPWNQEGRGWRGELSLVARQRGAWPAPSVSKACEGIRVQQHVLIIIGCVQTLHRLLSARSGHLK